MLPEVELGHRHARRLHPLVATTFQRGRTSSFASLDGTSCFSASSLPTSNFKDSTERRMWHRRFRASSRIDDRPGLLDGPPESGSPRSRPDRAGEYGNASGRSRASLHRARSVLQVGTARPVVPVVRTTAPSTLAVLQKRPHSLSVPTCGALQAAVHLTRGTVRNRRQGVHDHGCGSSSLAAQSVSSAAARQEAIGSVKAW